MTTQIDFVESKWHYLSPFSAHSILMWGEVFSTVEHAYQASRIKPGPQREAIKSAGSPMAAWRLGQICKADSALRTTAFDKDSVMDSLLRAKVAQHEDVKQILIESSGRQLVKNYDTDYYWGAGADGSGLNKMGHLWMKIRSELNETQQA